MYMAAKRKTSDKEARYTIVQDDDGTEFVIPVEKREDWFNWLDLDIDDASRLTLPLYAREMLVETNGMFTFTDPQGLATDEDDLHMATDHMRFPRSRNEVREQVIADLPLYGFSDTQVMTTSELEAIVDYHVEREQNADLGSVKQSPIRW